MKKLIVFVYLFIVFASCLTAQSYQPVFLLPAGEEVDGTPVFRKMLEKDADFYMAKNKFTKGFMAEATYMYGMIQNYLFNTGKLKQIEPVYLAFTENVGGFGKFGFILVDEQGNRIPKPDAGYIDLNNGVLNQNPAQVSSYTQIYPHELGHLMMRQLSGEGDGYASTMHYFCTTTDYVTAFAEGFAEHFENVAVDVEPDGRIKKTIEQNIRDINNQMPPKLYGYVRDNTWPLRQGYFLLTMPMWYQKLENIKRHSFVDSRLVIYNTRMADVSNTWKNILYRNSSVWPEPRKAAKTASQAAATEGIISAFFTRMSRNKSLKTIIYPNAMYAPFLPVDQQTDSLIYKSVFPLRNFYLKSFLVLNEYVRMDNPDKAPIAQFIDGYCIKFPDEKEKVLKIWAEASGRGFVEEPILPAIWLLNKDAKHYPWAMAPFGPTVSVFSVNLNTADSVDFMSFEGIAPEEAALLVSWRNKSGGYKKLDDINLVDGLSAESKKTLLSATFDKKYFEDHFQMPTFRGIIVNGLLNMLKISLMWFLLLGVVMFVVARIVKHDLRKIEFLYLFGKVIITALAGLAIFVLTGQRILYFGLFMLLVLLVKYLINRKKGMKLWFSLGTFLLASLAILYSLY
jgi:hypothetical protein